MHLPLFVANWKMHKTAQDSATYTKQLCKLVEKMSASEIVLAPPFTSLHAVAEIVRNTSIKIAGQNLHWESEGAYTGEISAMMLKEAGVDYVILGHSERRRLFGETDAIVNAKIISALNSGITPIICIGETLEERASGQDLNLIDNQISRGLSDLTEVQVSSLVIAYEPVWAIGTGQTGTPEQAAKTHAHVKSRLREWFGPKASTECRIIYGGSVQIDNIRDLITQSDVDGVLVGGASLDLSNFFKIVAGSLPTTV